MERLLLDTDVSAELEPLLRAVGFRVRFALRVGVDVADDTAILRWARRHGHILVCHDKHRDKKTRLELYPEVYRHGGRIIRVGGGPDQDPLISLGKILVHLDEWRKFFAGNDGMVVVHKQGINLTAAHQLYSQIQGTLDAERVTGRKVIKPSPARKARRQEKASEQLRMM